MEMPNVESPPVQDPKTGGHYVVLSFRELSAQEVFSAIYYYQAQTKRRAKKGQTIKIVSTIGHNS